MTDSLAGTTTRNRIAPRVRLPTTPAPATQPAHLVSNAYAFRQQTLFPFQPDHPLLDRRAPAETELQRLMQDRTAAVSDPGRQPSVAPHGPRHVHAERSGGAQCRRSFRACRCAISKDKCFDHSFGCNPKVQKWQKTWSAVATDTDERSKEAEVTAFTVRPMASCAQVPQQ